MNRAAHCIHMIALKYGCRVWFEYIESKSNWADGISRNGITDTLANELNFHCRLVTLPTWPWEGPVNALAKRVGLESLAGCSLG